jgi:hypothetical protein
MIGEIPPCITDMSFVVNDIRSPTLRALKKSMDSDTIFENSESLIAFTTFSVKRVFTNAEQNFNTFLMKKIKNF